MTYEPYITLQDDYQHAVTVASRRRGYATNAAYLRHIIIEDVRDAAPDKLPDHGADE